MDVLHLGFAAALLQVAGYLFYGSKILRGKVEPNPTSWLMFAYGTLLILVLEWDLNASMSLLILPLVCTLSSVAIAVYALRKTRRWWWPEHPFDRISFALDLLLTAVYFGVWFLLLNGFISEAQKDVSDVAILITGNLDILAFLPLLRQVYSRPSTEHAMPWMVWTVAYFMLAIATLVEVRGLNELALYPLLNMLVHGAIAVRVGWWHWMRARPIL